MRKKVQLTPVEIELHQAAVDGDLSATQAAISKGANVNSQDEEHYTTPLLWACSFGHFEVASYLLTAGADIDYVDDNHDTALHSAIAGGYDQIVQLLIESGANLDTVDGAGFTPLEAAIAYEGASIEQRLKIIDAILVTGYDVNTSNEYQANQTPLMVAVEAAANSGDTQLITHLIAKGADKEATDDEGSTAADYADLGEFSDVALQALET